MGRHGLLLDRLLEEDNISDFEIQEMWTLLFESWKISVDFMDHL